MNWNLWVPKTPCREPQTYPEKLTAQNREDWRDDRLYGYWVKYSDTLVGHIPYVPFRNGTGPLMHEDFPSRSDVEAFSKYKYQKCVIQVGEK